MCKPGLRSAGPEHIRMAFQSQPDVRIPITSCAPETGGLFCGSAFLSDHLWFDWNTGTVVPPQIVLLDQAYAPACLGRLFPHLNGPCKSLNHQEQA